MKKIKCLLAATAFSFLGVAPAAMAAGKLISINFGPNAVKPDVTALGTTGINTWNYGSTVIDLSLKNLYYSDGSLSNVSVDFNNNDGMGLVDINKSSFYNKPGYPLMINYLYSYGQPGSMEFSDLAPGKYNIYIYTTSSKETINELSVSINTSVGGSYTAQTSGSDGSTYSTFVLNKNYLVVPVTVGADGSLLLNYTAVGMSSDDTARIQGIEILAVPEASTVTMFLVGGILTVFYISLRTKEQDSLAA